MNVSIVVPTRDRVPQLRRCLAALAVQDADTIEVVVVDDGSDDHAAVEGAVAILSSARLVRSSGGGPATARNLGAQAATGDVLCFTDDDCEPEPGWARLLAGAAAASPGRVAAGRTVAPAGAAASVRASQAITNHLQAASLTPAGVLGFAPTCNLACGREVAARLPFDTSYPDAAAEDRDWWARALDSGVSGAYEPRAVVVHRQALNPRRFLRQQYRYGRGAARFRHGGGGARAYGGVGFYAGLVRAGFAQGPGGGGLVLAAQAATLAGVVSEAARRRRA